MFGQTVVPQLVVVLIFSAVLWYLFLPGLIPAVLGGRSMHRSLNARVKSLHRRVGVAYDVHERLAELEQTYGLLISECSEPEATQLRAAMEQARSLVRVPYNAYIRHCDTYDPAVSRLSTEELQMLEDDLREMREQTTAAENQVEAVASIMDELLKQRKGRE